MGSADVYPTDDDAKALRHRLVLALADIVDEIYRQPGCWQLELCPEAVAVRAIDALPTRFGAPMAVTAPGATRAFADGTLAGLIDIGDFMLGHPVVDLRAWLAAADRPALGEGYHRNQAPQGDFAAVWKVAMICADMKAIAGHANLAALASSDLARRLADL